MRREGGIHLQDACLIVILTAATRMSFLLDSSEMQHFIKMASEKEEKRKRRKSRQFLACAFTLRSSTILSRKWHCRRCSRAVTVNVREGMLYIISISGLIIHTGFVAFENDFLSKWIWQYAKFSNWFPYSCNNRTAVCRKMRRREKSVNKFRSIFLSNSLKSTFNSLNNNGTMTINNQQMIIMIS